MEKNQQSSYELIRRAEQILRDLKKITKELDNYIKKFQGENLDSRIIKNLNDKWKEGVRQFLEIEDISDELQNRQLEDEYIPSLQALHAKVLELKPNFEKNLMTIKNFDFVESFIGKEYEEKNDLEERLIENDADIEEVIDQNTLIRDRQRNILDINRALIDIKNINQHIFEIVKKDDEQINGILKKQEKNLVIVREKINVDLKRTEESQDNICKKTIIYGGLTLLLLALIVILYIYVL